MRILITGGTGFIGSALAKRASELGHTVTVFGCINDEWEQRRGSDLSSQGVDVTLGSVTDAPVLAKVCRDKDVVIHLAAAQHETNVGDEYFWQINVQGTKNVLNACVAGRVGQFLHGSSIGVYGDAPDGEIEESSHLRPVNIYGRTKLEGEKLAAAYADRIPMCIVRISEIYGPGDKRLLKLFRAVKSGWFPIIGSGRNTHQPMYIDDLVESLLRIRPAEVSTGEVVNVAGTEVLTTVEMIDSIGRALETDFRKIKVPMWPVLAGAFLMEKTMAPFGLSPPVTRRRLDFFRKSFLISTKKAKSLFGLEPKVSFADGAKRCAEWYCAERLL